MNQKFEIAIVGDYAIETSGLSLKERAAIRALIESEADMPTQFNKRTALTDEPDDSH